jgi:hypothetical protein
VSGAQAGGSGGRAGGAGEVAHLLAPGDHFVGQAAQLLCLVHRGLNALVLDELGDHRAQHRPPMRGRSSQFSVRHAVLHYAVEF